jgi:hypothetical protein
MGWKLKNLRFQEELVSVIQPSTNQQPSTTINNHHSLCDVYAMFMRCLCDVYVIKYYTQFESTIDNIISVSLPILLSHHSPSSKHHSLSTAIYSSNTYQHKQNVTLVGYPVNDGISWCYLFNRFKWSVGHYIINSEHEKQYY